MKQNFKFILVFLFLAVTMSFVSALDWSETQPAGDFNKNWYTSAMSTNGQIILAGVFGERLYISTNGGTSWTETQPAGNANKNWHTSAISTDGQIILAGVYGGRLYLSTNGGTSWTETQPTGNVDKDWITSAMSTDGQIILAGVYGGRLYISTNDGTSWTETQPAGNANKNWRTSAMSTNGQIILAGVFGERLYISTNGGTSWTETQPAGNANKNWRTSAMSTDGQIILAGVNDGRLYLSTNGGTSWTETQPAGSVNKNWYTSAMSSNGNIMIVGAYNGKLYISTNGGTSWTETQPAGNADKDWRNSAMSTSGQIILAGVFGGRLYISKQLASPTASVGTGTYNNNFSITLNNNNEADIYYTTDGSDPDDTDILYSGAISITGTTTLKAISWVSDINKSLISSYTYTMVVAGTPTADKDSGLYYDPFNVTLTKTGTTTDTKLTYTLNGDAPTIASTEYTTPIEISADTTLKFAEFKTGYTATSIVTKTYEVREPITNFNFYDENTLLPIPTVTIADANGSTYTSDVNGLWTTSLSNIAKSFTISKTGYDTRDLDFYFKRQDANFNFMLSQDGNNTEIEFLVKDANDNIWSNKYLMFVNDTNIITSVLTSATGTATASLLANGDYNALLYDATGTLVDTYEKTTVTVNKPKNEITLGAISPYDITVGGLLGYSLTNQSASSVSFNIFAGTQDFYYFNVVDYNAVPADRKYIPRQYFTQVPMGTGYESALTYQPYLLLETDAVVPKITVLDQLNKPTGYVDIFISRSISNVVTIVESGKTTSTGNMSFSAYPLEYYYINVIYNGVDKGTFRVQPRESSDNFIIVIDTSEDVVDTGELIITADFSGTPKVVNIDDTNINADITITQSLNQATSYNLYLIQNNVTKASTSGAISGLVTSIDYDFDSSVVDRFNNNLTLKLVVNYPDGNQTFYYTITATKNAKGLMYFAPQIINDIGQPLGIILAILITGIILATLTFSGLNISPTAITILGVLILGVFMFLGWLDTGITVLGFDIARFFYVLMAIAMIYFMMRGEQYA